MRQRVITGLGASVAAIAMVSPLMLSLPIAAQPRDVRAPELLEVQIEGKATAAVRVDTSGSSVALPVRLRVIDSGLGTRSVLVHLTSPTGSVTTVTAARVSGDAADGWYAATLNLAKRSPRGRYSLDVDLLDAAGNRRRLSGGVDGRFEQSGADIGPARIQQMGRGDTRPPSVSTLTVSATEISTAQRAVEVEISATVSDGDAGIASVDVMVSGPDCQDCFGSASAVRASGDASSGTYQRTVTFPMGSPQGSYRIRVIARDRVGNVADISSSRPGDLRVGIRTIGPGAITQRGDGRILEGYPVRLAGDRIASRALSVSPGEEIGLAMSTLDSPARTADLRISNAAGRVMTTLTGIEIPSAPQATQAPWLHGQGFPVVTRFTIPATWPSGVYVVGDDPAMSFIVRPKASTLSTGGDESRIGVLIATNTFTAYSITEGRSLYQHPTFTPRLSFLRYWNQVKADEWLPLVAALTRGEVRLASEVIYLADSDLQSSSYLDRIDTLVIVGHSEYWTGRARANVDSFIDGGGNVVVASGNTLWWQSSTPGGAGVQLEVLKMEDDFDVEALKHASYAWQFPDPRTSAVRTLGADFNRGGFAVSRRPEGDGWGGYLICAPEHPIFAGTGLTFGSVLPLAKVTEYDGPPIVGFDDRGCPIPDAAAVDAVGMQILAFDLGYRVVTDAPTYTVGAITLMKRTPSSGIVVNFASKGLSTTLTRADETPFAQSSRRLLRILGNTLDLLQRDVLPVAALDPDPAVTTPFVTPSSTPVPADVHWLTNRPPHDQNLRFTGVR